MVDIGSIPGGLPLRLAEQVDNQWGSRKKQLGGEQCAEANGHQPFGEVADAVTNHGGWGSAPVGGSALTHPATQEVANPLARLDVEGDVQPKCGGDDEEQSSRCHQGFSDLSPPLAVGGLPSQGRGSSSAYQQGHLFATHAGEECPGKGLPLAVLTKRGDQEQEKGN